jgi:hypothetical protein
MKMETIEDIFWDIRAQNQGLSEDGYALSPLAGDLLRLADRIEAAHKRELAVAENATTTPTCKDSLQVGNAATMREALEKFSAVNFNRLKFPLDGDSSAIYNSDKKEITIPYWRVAELLNEVKVAQDMARAALSAPPRNCDVGSAENQEARWQNFCNRFDDCMKCPLNKGPGLMDNGLATRCFARWSQMPYGSEVKK